MMLRAVKIKNNRKSIIVGMFVLSILVNGGFFPIVNFNPDNPVDLGITMRLIIIVMTYTFYKTIGSLEAVVLSEWPVTFIGIYNVGMVICGLGFRYLLEFGEVSNTYNFTVLNVSFQLVALTLVSTVVCVWERKKK